MIQNMTDDLGTRRLITVPFLLANIYYFFLKAKMFVKKFFLRFVSVFSAALAVLSISDSD